MKSFELIRYPNGTSTVQDPDGRVMHSSIGPWAEAIALYADQARLRERLSQDSREPLVVWDVGLGIAANALAAIEAASNARRPLALFSFEHELSGARLALERHGEFDFLDRHREKVEMLLRDGEWNGGKIRWRLQLGDFRNTYRDAPTPDIVFFDFYAPKTCPELWTPELFTALAKRSTPERPLDLYTYSAATPVRSALFLSGLYVGHGRSTPMKSETTVASTDPSRLEGLLGAEWWAKLMRSHSPAPYAWEPARATEARELLSRHPQLRGFGSRKQSDSL